MQNNNLETSKKSMDKLQNTYAIAYLSIVPLRAVPQHRSEMVSQVLFGEYMKVLKTEDEWSFIQLEQDSYEGWIETSQLFPISEKDFEKCTTSPKVKVSKDGSFVEIDERKIFLLKGTTLLNYNDGSFEFVTEKIQFSGVTITGKQNRKQLVEIANSYLNVPYLWGGKTSFGIDCSGFSQIVYHLCGYTLQRDASLQAQQGQLVAFLEQASAGDLAFFDNEEGAITHVGIVLQDRKIIHAAKGKVRIDRLDQEGIYNDELKKYTHHLRMVRSYF